jgi:hypothetical protein
VDAATLKQVMDDGAVLAIETVDTGKPKPALYAQWKERWTEVLGSDSHNLTGERKPGSYFTWVKMAAPSLEGLRLALLDGGSFSIRRSDASGPFSPHALPAHFLESIEISDARYMGRGEAAKLSLSPWFNVLAGGRGTGKSTVVHALRAVYRRDGEMERTMPGRAERLVAGERHPRGSLPGDGGRHGSVRTQVPPDWR